MTADPRSRSEARAYLDATLRSAVPNCVIDDVWDNLIAPLYDGQPVRTPPDSSGHDRTPPDSLSGQPGHVRSTF